MSHLPHELAYLIYHEAPPGDNYVTVGWFKASPVPRTVGLSTGSFHLVQDLIVAAGRRCRTLIIRSTCDGHFVYHNAILICGKGRSRGHCVSHVTWAYVNRRGDSHSLLPPLITPASRFN